MVHDLTTQHKFVGNNKICEKRRHEVGKWQHFDSLHFLMDVKNHQKKSPKFWFLADFGPYSNFPQSNPSRWKNTCFRSLSKVYENMLNGKIIKNWIRKWYVSMNISRVMCRSIFWLAIPLPFMGGDFTFCPVSQGLYITQKNLSDSKDHNLYLNDTLQVIKNP